MTVFSVHARSARDGVSSNFSWVIKVRGGDPVHVGGEFPGVDGPDEPRPVFTLYEDQAGHKPLCSVTRQTDGGLAVMGPDRQVLGALRSPVRPSRWRPRYELALPDGTTLVGRGGTAGSWIMYAVLSPLTLIYNVASFVGGYGVDWHLPTRTAWRTGGGSGLGVAPLKFYGITDKYKVRTTRLDARVAYAQAVLHYWSSLRSS